jgi:hypothetical protein
MSYPGKLTLVSYLPAKPAGPAAATASVSRAGPGRGADLHAPGKGVITPVIWTHPGQREVVRLDLADSP